MDSIRIEVHNRCRFASKQYYKYLTEFAKSNLEITKDRDSGKSKINTKFYQRLSGNHVKKLHLKLTQAYRIYEHYTKEYNDTLDKINLK